MVKVTYRIVLNNKNITELETDSTAELLNRIAELPMEEVYDVYNATGETVAIAKEIIEKAPGILLSMVRTIQLEADRCEKKECRDRVYYCACACIFRGRFCKDHYMAIKSKLEKPQGNDTAPLVSNDTAPLVSREEFEDLKRKMKALHKSSGEFLRQFLKLEPKPK